jgi:2-polyprenyl-3-methyl-5-hydroxy-6-metoxy-1,4-benzoquinol methylase
METIYWNIHTKKYDNVYLGILEFNVENYDFIILGDVLEHIPVKLAQELINKFQRKGIEYMVAVPYMMEQGEWGV